MASLDTIAADYRTITEACGLLDRSERGKLALAGGEAPSFLQGQVTNDVEALPAGRGCYAAFLTPKGKMLGDLRILATDDELLLDTERVALQGLFNMIRRFSLGYDVELQKRTLERGLLSLIGPGAADAAGAGSLSDDEHAHALVTVPGAIWSRERFARTSGSTCSATPVTLKRSATRSRTRAPWRWLSRRWNACGSSADALATGSISTIR